MSRSASSHTPLVAFFFKVAPIALCLALAPRGSEAAPPDASQGQPDFSRPGTLFATTLAESSSTLGVTATELELLLRAGELILINTRPSTKAVPWLSTAAVLVDAPPEQVYAAMSDVDRYVEFVPQVTSSRKTKVTEEIDQVFLELSVHVLLTEVKNKYSLYYYYQPGKRLDWILAHGEFAANIGSFEVIPLPGSPTRSILFHTSYALPRDRILTSLFGKVPDLDLMVNITTGTLMIRAMRARAEKLHTRAGGTSRQSPLPSDVPQWLRSKASILSRLCARGEVYLMERSSPVLYTGVARLPRTADEIYFATTHLDLLTAAHPSLKATPLEQSASSARVKMKSSLELMVDFDADYTLAVTLEPPLRSSFVGEPGGELQGVAGSFEVVPLGAGLTLAMYRNTSDLNSLGFTMRKLLSLEPALAHGIHIAETRRMMQQLRAWRP